jgi:hypothetical protein
LSRSKLKLVLGCAPLLGAPFTASAQDWDWTFTPYLWTAGIDGDVALGALSRPVDISFGDLVDVLAGAALIHAEAGRNDYKIFGDVVWMSLEPDDEIATIGGVAEAQFDTMIYEVGFVRELSSVGVEAGLRYWDFELEIDPALTAAVQRDDNWMDLFVGIRNEQPLGDDWRLTAEASIGAGDSDFTWGAQLVFARELDSGNAFVAGFKALGVDYSNDNVDGLSFGVDTIFAGATIGFLFD